MVIHATNAGYWSQSTDSLLAMLATSPAGLRADEAKLFAEVDPNQKERVILALRKMGHKDQSGW
jgi:hypothetical protein